MFEQWRELFGSDGKSDFDTEFEHNKIIDNEGFAYYGRPDLVVEVTDDFRFYQFCMQRELLRIREQSGMDDLAEMRFIGGSPYVYNGRHCSNANGIIPIPKREEIESILNRLPNAEILSRFDAIAFYKPFHFHEHWGLYFLIDRISLMSEGVYRALQGYNPGFTKEMIYEMVFRKTYFHETYHHKVEMFATKLEFGLRSAVYKNAFHKFYCATYGLDYCLEEGFANVYGTLKCARWMRDKYHLSEIEVKEIIQEFILKRAPKGYRIAYDILNLPAAQIEDLEHSFLEIVSSFSYEEILGSSAQAIDPQLYGLFTYKLDPKINVKNKVTFLLRV